MTRLFTDIKPIIGVSALMLALAAIALQWRSGLPFVEGSLLDWTDTILMISVAGAITLIIAVLASAGEKVATTWIMAGALVWSLLVADGAGLDHIDQPTARASDFGALAIWVVTSLLVLRSVVDVRFPFISRLSFVMGLLLQSLSVVTNLGDGSVFRIANLPPATFLGVDESLEALSLAAYFSGLAYAIVGIENFASGASQPLQWRVFQSAAGRSLAIAWESLAYVVWRLANLKKPYSSYYSDSIGRKLDRGRSHRTLGTLRWSKDILSRNEGGREEQFEDEGRRRFDILLSLGIGPGDCVIDYGCGSLRIGQHFIRHLGPGKYWGLDVTDRFYSDGLRLLPDDLIAEKRPRLAVIGPTSLAEAKSAAADCVFAVAVMKHVPREEIEDFWRNIMCLLKPSAIAIVDCNISGCYMRTSGKDWSYPEAAVRDLLGRLAPGRPVTFHHEKARHRFRGQELRRASIVVGPLPK